MITKKTAFSKAWQVYQKLCDLAMPPYYHFEVGFRAAWNARTTIKAEKRRKTVRRIRPCNSAMVPYKCKAIGVAYCDVAGMFCQPDKLCLIARYQEREPI